MTQVVPTYKEYLIMERKKYINARSKQHYMDLYKVDKTPIIKSEEERKKHFSQKSKEY